MAELWTSERIIALAPDGASAKAGQGLATARKWSALGRDGQAAWGLCQGSGAKPYQTQIALAEGSAGSAGSTGSPAFKCTCPSHKFPCKHSLGLFLLLASEPGAFSDEPPPGWVTEWLASRAERAEKAALKAGKAAEPDQASDPAAQAKRAADRLAKVTAGVADLELWLGDIIRRGLAAVQHEPTSFWESMAARMVDAQAPGLARLVREAGSAAAGAAGHGQPWQERLLERLSRLNLLLQAFNRIDALAPPQQADIRSAVGWTIDQKELLAQPGEGGPGTARWLVVAQRIEQEDRLRVQRTWLWRIDGGATASGNSAALVLDFAHGAGPLDSSLVEGTTIDAEVVFFPGAWPMRALVKPPIRQQAAPGAVPPACGFASVDQAAAAFARGGLAACPWLETQPVLLRQVVPVGRGPQSRSAATGDPGLPGDGWLLRDAAGAARVLPIRPGFPAAWHLAAVSGGHAIDVFGNWDGRWFLPLSAWSDGRFIPLRPATGEPGGPT